jgi:hypothetical protein
VPPAKLSAARKALVREENSLGAAVVCREESSGNVASVRRIFAGLALARAGTSDPIRSAALPALLKLSGAQIETFCRGMRKCVRANSLPT